MTIFMPHNFDYCENSVAYIIVIDGVVFIGG
jgi:hypothetical protein